jgi:methylated-DNA-protein-cysteine methyltransferase-like protein
MYMTKRDSAEHGFRERVESIVKQIPKGKVMTYGQLAALGGNARSARIVGGIAHFGNPKLPWQRVVNKTGGLAAGYPGGQVLEKEGIKVTDELTVDIEKLLWWPPKKDKDSLDDMDFDFEE